MSNKRFRIDTQQCTKDNATRASTETTAQDAPISRNKTKQCEETHCLCIACRWSFWCFCSLPLSILLLLEPASQQAAKPKRSAKQLRIEQVYGRLFGMYRRANKKWNYCFHSISIPFNTKKNYGQCEMQTLSFFVTYDEDQRRCKKNGIAELHFTGEIPVRVRRLYYTTKFLTDAVIIVCLEWNLQIDLCVCAMCMRWKSFSILRSNSFVRVCVCGVRLEIHSFDFVCVSILILPFPLYSRKSVRFVSFHFISIETSITIVLHVINMLVFHHISSQFEWVKPVCAQQKRPAGFIHTQFVRFFRCFVRIIYILLCGPDILNGERERHSDRFDVNCGVYYKMGA